MCGRAMQEASVLHVWQGHAGGLSPACVAGPCRRPQSCMCGRAMQEASVLHVWQEPSVLHVWEGLPAAGIPIADSFNKQCGGEVPCCWC
jgi:hypothetical protein